AAALADIPGEEAQAYHSPANLPATRRPLTSAPASGDMRRKNGTDNNEIAPTTASANEKSAALDTSRSCVASITYSKSAPVPTPTLCDNCCAMLVRLVARLKSPGGPSALAKVMRPEESGSRPKPTCSISGIRKGSAPNPMRNRKPPIVVIA